MYSLRECPCRGVGQGQQESCVLCGEPITADGGDRGHRCHSAGDEQRGGPSQLPGFQGVSAAQWLLGGAGFGCAFGVSGWERSGAGYEKLRVFKEEVLEHLPEGIERVYLRTDTAGYQQDLLKHCAEGKDERFGVIGFTVAVM